MKYKIGDIIKYNTKNYDRIIINDINKDNNGYLSYKIDYIHINGDIETPLTPWVDANLLDEWTEFDKTFLRERKLKRIQNDLI